MMNERENKMMNGFFMLRWVLLLLVIFSVKVSAQEKGGEKKSSQRMETIVVTASRYPEKMRDAVMSVSVLGGETIKDHQLHTLQEALGFFPGVTLATNGTLGGASSIFMRGSESNHTVLCIDGIRQGRSLAGGYDLANFSLDNFQRIEVVRGPSSVLYGADTIGGVINLITREGGGLKKSEHSASFEAGSDYTFRESVMSRMSLGDFDYSLEASRLDTENVRPNNDYHLSSLRARVGYSLNDDLTLALAGQYYTSEGGTPSSIFFPSTEGNLLREVWSISPRVEWQTTSAWKQTLNFTRDHQRQVYEEPSFSIHNRLQFNTTQASWLHEILLEDMNISAGIQLEDLEVYQVNASGVKDINAHQFGLGFFAESTWKITERLHWLAGIRWDRFSDFDDEVTWRSGISYRAAQAETVFRSSVGSAYSPPSSQDLYFPFASNPHLAPERSVGWEIGVEQPLFSDDLNLSCTYFYNKIDDYIEFNGSQPENVGKASTEGIEISANYRLSKKFSLAAHYTYLDALDSKNKRRLLRRPRHTWGLTAQWLPSEKVNVALEVLYLRDREDVHGGSFQRIDAKDYAVVNLRCAWKVSEYVEIFGRVNNLFNEEYSSVHGYPALGIGVHGGIKVLF